jgi:hypothetical protein
MGQWFHQWVHELSRLGNRMGPTEWLVVFIAVALAGLVLMRGFGSRTGY